MMSDSSDSYDSDDSVRPWITYFCSLPENKYFCEVDIEYIKDNFNLYGLKQFIDSNYNKALDMILDRYDDVENNEIARVASQLYGLIHARYILSSNGLDAMKKKYSQKEFGDCPRYYCKGQATLPLGLYDEPARETMRLYCPRCRDIYSCDPISKHLDGAAFGSSFAHLFFMTYDKELVPNLPTEMYVPRVFGFRIHGTSSSLAKAATGTDGTPVDGIRGEAGRKLNSHVRRRNSYDDGSDDSWNDAVETSKSPIQIGEKQLNAGGSNMPILVSARHDVITYPRLANGGGDEVIGGGSHSGGGAGPDIVSASSSTLSSSASSSSSSVLTGLIPSNNHNNNSNSNMNIKEDNGGKESSKKRGRTPDI